MSAGSTGAAPRVVLRQGGAVLVPVLVWLFCAGAVLDAVVEGSAEFALRTALVMAAVSFATWLVLASPCLVVERAGLRIVNPLRVHWVPYDALVLVRVRGLTTITVAQPSGRPRAITSWNAPGVPRRYTAAPAPVAEVIERYQTSWEHGDQGGAPPFATAVRWRSVLILAGLTGVNIAIWLR
jgi:hypothetical protein